MNTPASSLVLAVALYLFAGMAPAFTAGSSDALPRPATEKFRPFLLEALVDFPDDLLKNGRPLTADDIDALMRRLAALGFKRVSWSYYADGRGGFLVPSNQEGAYAERWKHYAETYRTLGNPLKVAVEAGHRHGLEVYAYFKPYETGPAMMFPSGSSAAKTWGLLGAAGGQLAWLDPFVRDHPHLRLKRRAAAAGEAPADAPIRTLRLAKQDASPTRLTREHLQVWTSADNHRYQPANVTFTVSESVEPAPREVRDQKGKLLTRQGDPVRVLTLSGLDLREPFILLTTNLGDGPADFMNSGLELMQPLDARGRKIPGVYGQGGAIWCRELANFRTEGVMFDYGWGAKAVALDTANRDGQSGFIAFARGYNEYLPGALCETEPAVQQFWLACLDEIIAAGVDGVDFREENHSTHTDTPEDYGFNDVVLAKARARPGELSAAIAQVRGEAYTDFLRASKKRLAAAGIRMRYNLQMDFFRAQPPTDRLLAYPANIHFDWQRWVDEGLMDEAILRFYSLPASAVFEDAVTQEMIARCRDRGIPLTVNRYVTQAADKLPEELARVRADGRFSGFIFYEVYNYITFGPQPGECEVTYAPVIKSLAAPR